MKTSLRTILIAALLLAGGLFIPLKSGVTADDNPLYGYSADSSRTEREWEQKMRAIPDPANLRAYMQRLSARPHNVGSPYDKDNAEWMLGKFKEFGLDAHIETFSVLFPTPKERLVELVEGGPHFTAKLQEPPVPEDPTSNQTAEQLPSYNAYSIDGDVTAPLVYVNYGMPEDYEVSGAPRRFREGRDRHRALRQSWRGIKPLVGAEHGASRLHHLFRSPRRWLFRWPHVSQRALASKRGRAARQRARQRRIHGRPLTPGYRRNGRCQAVAAEGCAIADENSGAAYFLCGCGAASCSD